MKKKDDQEFDLSDILGGSLNILGLNIDLAKLLSSPEDMKERLEELREKLKKAGGRETLSDEEWRRGEVSISGHLRTRGILGDREYHIGTRVPPRGGRAQPKQPQPSEVMEPAVDIFREDEEIVIVAEVPGADLADLEVRVQDDVLYLSTQPTARRSYRKEIKLDSSVDSGSLKATCRNGILEIRLRKNKS